MPNGESRNWIRLLSAIAGFRVRYGCWPTRVRIIPECLNDLRNSILTPDEFAKVEEKVKLIADKHGQFLAEDDIGRRFHYGIEDFPSRRPDIEPDDWLGVFPEIED
jgi:hypothetical protein